MKVKISKLSDKLLDYAVAKALGYEITINENNILVYSNLKKYLKYFNPSREWHIAGPIIEENKINLNVSILDSGGIFWTATDTDEHPYWEAGQRFCNQEGETVIIAAMRCFVEMQWRTHVTIPNDHYQLLTND